MGTQQQYQNENNSGQNSNGQNGTTTTTTQQQQQQQPSSKPVIERGASWSFSETKLLIALWSQDMVQRQLTNSKRTRHVWEKIAERIREHGYERTADQVRTRVFNMIAEYRRIMKNPTPERRKKCIFFDALHRIYQAKDANNLETVIMEYGDGGEQFYNFDPLEFNPEEMMEVNGDNETSDNEDMMAYSLSPDTFANYIGNFNDFNNDAFPQAKRGRFDNSMLNESIMMNNNNNTNANNFQSSHHDHHHLDQSASALLIDRMFTHLSQETEVMREWVNLERERLQQEVMRRKEEKEREERREKSFLDILTKFQEKVFTILKQNNNNNNNNNSNTCPHPTNVAKMDEPKLMNGADK